MKKVPLMLGLAAAVCSLPACQKDLEDTPTPQAVAANASRADQLAARDWHQTGLTVNTVSGDKAVTADLFSHVSPGMLDQSVTFQAGGVYTVLKGGAAGPLAGRWQFNAASDSVIVTLPGQVRRLAVTELSPTSLRLTFTDAAVNGAVSTYTSVYSH
ncbi:hypothetical protein MUN81_15805 [Hymenobacter sp. 5317J-9]|uniref:hypothetical protein n=1 Tax=Hymenobacter sp. 5317J-9 TaxID=2932250 RepID=UPI001FD6A40B|nr:hypothetical protein [Hymenobacter sp. 5317J-9]UOQ96700.1 hypothetical protein MUN81_15805 [Hymenobacter sp. 5317J-9]